MRHVAEQIIITEGHCVICDSFTINSNGTIDTVRSQLFKHKGCAEN